VEFNQRVQYQSIVSRPPLRGPDGLRVIVWPIVVLEVWDIGRAMPRQVVPPPAARPVPDYLNWSWHEYEMRIAFWRLKRFFDAQGIAPSVSINSAVCTTYPEVAEACRDAGWEFVAHGVMQRPVSEIDDEPAMIAQCMREIEAFTGRKPRGWASPGIAQTRDSVDHLAGAGLEYACDWVLDDQPFEIETRHGPLTGLPYTVDLNDVPTLVVAKQPIQTFRQAICDAFDRLHAEGEESVRVMSVVLHPYVCATPSRIAHIEQAFHHMRRPGVAFWSGDKILDWYRSARSAAAMAEGR
jgi:allantoinase